MSSPDPTTHRILLVDDEPTVVSTLEMALSGEGWQVDTAGTAEEALAMLRQSRYDLLLVDKNLPGMSGVEMLREVREQRPEQRAFLITGYASVDAALETLHIGVEGFLEKPFDDIFEVVARVREVLARPPRRGRPITVGNARGHFSRAMSVLQAAHVAHGETRTLRILVVSPNEDEQQWLAAHLRGSGDQVEVIDDLETAAQILEHQPPDVVILDADYDERALFEVLEGQQGRHRTVTVVAARKPSLTAIIRLIDLGVRAVVEKPFEERNVRAKLDALLAAAREGKVELGRGTS